MHSDFVCLYRAYSRLHYTLGMLYNARHSFLHCNIYTLFTIYDKSEEQRDWLISKLFVIVVLCFMNLAFIFVVVFTIDPTMLFTFETPSSVQTLLNSLPYLLQKVIFQLKPLCKAPLSGLSPPKPFYPYLYTATCL